MIQADNYGIDLVALQARAIEEGKDQLAQIFAEAIAEAEAGQTEWYTKICRDIAFMISNTNMDALRINPLHIMKIDNCSEDECK